MVTLKTWIGSVVVILTSLPLEVRAADFFTVNRDALSHFWMAAESSNRPVTIVSFGDSMADSWLSPNYRFMNKLTERLGIAGYSLNNYRNALTYSFTNGATYADPDGIWFCRYLVLPPGAGVGWENQANAGGVLCDTMGIFFVSHPQGGQFTLSVSTNGGPWSPKLVLDGYSVTSIGRYTNLSVAPNYHRLRVDGGTGTNFIIGIQLLMAHTNGVNVAFLDHWGTSLIDVTNVSPAIRVPIFAALNPDLLIWHMKEDGSLATSNRMESCDTWWKTSAPNCDVVYVGTPWISLDAAPNSTWTPDQNTVVRNIALRHNRAYADLMQPTISYDWLVSHGFMQDATHLNSNGSRYCADIMWDDLGFFALGLDRRISLQPTGPQLQLSYTTTTNARYRLETSTNLQTWSAVVTNPVATASFVTNFVPTAAASFYRLGLTPP
jgi:hypothetical protein